MLCLIIFVDAALIVHVKVSSIQECIRMSSWRLLLAKVTSILVLTLSSLLILVDLLILEAVWVVVVATTESMLGYGGSLIGMNLRWNTWGTPCLVLKSQYFRLQRLLRHFLFSHFKFTLSLFQMTSRLQKMLKIAIASEVREIKVCKTT